MSSNNNNASLSLSYETVSLVYGVYIYIWRTRARDYCTTHQRRVEPLAYEPVHRATRLQLDCAVAVVAAVRREQAHTTQCTLVQLFEGVL